MNNSNLNMSLSSILKKTKQENYTKQVVTRFPPSPTGFMHIGTARTALFNYLFAQKMGGKMLFRLEDTDRERSKKEYEKDILEGLGWLNIKYDGEVKRQSERTEIYKKYLKEMINTNNAYEAEENKDGTGRVIRFKNPNIKIKFSDLIRGDIEFDTAELKDFVIAKDMNTPLYHLAVVVDDFEMGVTHIIRGDDGISNTPRQILIGCAIGAPEPIYAHIPLILAPDKSKLSKRHGAVSVNEYEKMGYLSEAMVNFLALMGWHPKDDKEIFNIKELVKEFEIERVQKSGAVFNQEKLDWINKEYLKKLSGESVERLIMKYLPEEIKNLQGFSNKIVEKIIPIVLERINKFGDVKDMANRGELTYFFETPTYDKEKLVWKNSSSEKTKINIDKIIELLEKADFGGADSVKKSLWNYAEEKGRGDVLWPMRYALSGLDKSPDPFTLAVILGKEETINRLKTASNLFGGATSK